MAPRKPTTGKPTTGKPTDDDAAALCHAIHQLGHYAHVDVQAHRGHLNIFAGDEEPLARLTPLANRKFGLSFRHHTGRWEPMPFTGDIGEMARTVVSTLGPYLEGPDLTPRISGSDI